MFAFTIRNCVHFLATTLFVLCFELLLLNLLIVYFANTLEINFGKDALLFILLSDIVKAITNLMLCILWRCLFNIIFVINFLFYKIYSSLIEWNIQQAFTNKDRCSLFLFLLGNVIIYCNIWFLLFFVDIWK